MVCLPIPRSCNGGLHSGSTCVGPFSQESLKFSTDQTAIGFLVTIAIWFVFHPTTPEHVNLPFREKLHRLDLVGGGLLIPGIALFQVAIQRGGALYPWTSPNVWALLVVGGLLLVAFTWVQIRKGDR